MKSEISYGNLKSIHVKPLLIRAIKLLNMLFSRGQIFVFS